ncbi:MAG: tetratricopeptide repeat protein [Nitrospinae bacterium]|nr:tetratricopeptide repeat protein [Nitrospinota bacterium]
MRSQKLAVVVPLCLFLACATAETKKMRDYAAAEGERVSSRGDDSLQKGATLDAIRRYETALRQFQRNDDLPKIDATDLKLAGVFLMRNDVETARKFVEGARLVVKKENLGMIEEDLAVSESSLLVASGAGAEASALLKDFAKKAPARPSLRLAIAMGRAALATNDLAESYKIFDGALAAGKGTPFESAVRVDLARVLLKMGKPGTALEHLKAALELDKKAGATVVLGDTLHFIGAAYEASLDYSSAEYYYGRALSANLQTDLTEKAEADRIARSRVRGLAKAAPGKRTD